MRIKFNEILIQKKMLCPRNKYPLGSNLIYITFVLMRVYSSS